MNRVCLFEARKAAEFVRSSRERLSRSSSLFRNLPNLTEINPADVKIGGELGYGGYNRVDAGVIQMEGQEKQEVAIKSLKRDVMLDIKRFRHGATDLVTEAKILSVLDHPNIIKLHGVAAGSPDENIATGEERAFFIAVERLHDTLDQRMESWHIGTEPYNFVSRKMPKFFKRKNQQLVERLKVAIELASALEYVHSNHIVFRDLKPNNIGFGKDGKVKLFDFGLAKELKVTDMTLDGRYSMSGNTGTLRYMAPEVAKDLPYHLSVDVYSFGILLWEMLTGKPAFEGYTYSEYFDRVVSCNERPSLKKKLTGAWPVELTALLSKCWSPIPQERPNFTVILQKLGEILESVSTILESYEKHDRRRGIKVFRNRLRKVDCVPANKYLAVQESVLAMNARH